MSTVIPLHARAARFQGLTSLDLERLRKSVVRNLCQGDEKSLRLAWQGTDYLKALWQAERARTAAQGEADG